MEVPQQTLLNGGLFAKRYRVEALLGAGAMGKVYLVSDTMLENEKVALKVLNFELNDDSNLSARFLREVQLTRKVTHPNVIRTFDVGSDEARLYFTMEFVEGQTLRQKVVDGPLDGNEIADILSQICRGLGAIHDCNIIHRDLKSPNVIMTSSGIVKISDFGVARPGASQMTGIDELLGSATHMAPEVWREGQISNASDIYALGVVAYELATGVLPFDGKTPHEVMWQHLCQEPVPPADINPDLPRWLDALILRLLAKNPEMRPQTAGEVLADLNQARHGGATQGSCILPRSGTLEAEAAPGGKQTASEKRRLPNQAPLKAAGSGALTQLSFSLPPSPMEPEELVREGATPQQSRVLVFHKPRSEPRCFSSIARLSLKHLGAVALTLIIGAGLWLLALDWPLFYSILLEPLNTALPKTGREIFSLVLPFFLWPFVLSAPLAPVTALASGLRPALISWLHGTWLAAIVILLCCVHHTVRVVRYNPDGLPRPAIHALQTGVKAGAVNAAQISLFRHDGTYFRPSGKNQSLALIESHAPGWSQTLPYYGLLLCYMAMLTVLLSKYAIDFKSKRPYLGPLLIGLCFTSTLILQIYLTQRSYLWGINLERAYELRTGVFQYHFNNAELLCALAFWSVLAVLGAAFGAVTKR